jgi:hypothetical protein
MKKTFGDRVFRFYRSLEIPGKLPLGVRVMNPYKDIRKLAYIRKFVKKFYSDNRKRILVLGINPGRFGGGESGINFTDGTALKKFCGIESSLGEKRELSSVFVYDFIRQFGGAKKFYKSFFLSAISPLGFTKNGKNYNYYDDREFFEFIKGFIVDALNKQIKIGISRKVAVILGTGKNQKYLGELNKEYSFFDEYYVLEHPRYIMQYKKKSEKFYIQKYNRILVKVRKIC